MIISGLEYKLLLIECAGLIGDGYLPSRAAPEKSDRQLAKAIGVHHETVGVQRKELESTGGIRQLDRTVGADGKERPRNSTKFYQVFRAPHGPVSPPAAGSAAGRLLLEVCLVTRARARVKRRSLRQIRSALRITRPCACEAPCRF